MGCWWWWPHFSSMAVVRAGLVLLVITVFPSVVARPWMFHIMAGIDQTSRCVLSSCRQARMLGISAGMDRKDNYAACLRPRSLPTSAAACAWLVFLVTIFYAVFPSVVDMLKILGILVGMDQKDSTSLVVFFGIGMCRAGLQVTLHPAVCSFDCRPHRQRWQYAAVFTGDETFRAVFCSFSSAP